MGLSYLKIESLPNQYDIVWCLYPRREDKLSPGPVARPALVLDAQVDIAQSRARLLVAYGTGTIDSDTGDLIIDDWEEVRELGLHKPTRFCVRPEKRMLLPWCAEYFVPPQYVLSVGVIAGSLSKEQIVRLRMCFEAQGLSLP